MQRHTVDQPYEYTAIQDCGCIVFYFPVLVLYYDAIHCPKYASNGIFGAHFDPKDIVLILCFLISFNLACPEKPRLWSQSLAHICPNESAGGGMHHAVLKLQDLTFFWLVVARVRVSPFNQLNLHESDETKVVLKKQKHSVSMARPKNTN